MSKTISESPHNLINSVLYAGSTFNYFYKVNDNEFHSSTLDLECGRNFKEEDNLDTLYTCSNARKAQFIDEQLAGKYVIRIKYHTWCYDDDYFKDSYQVHIYENNEKLAQALAEKAWEKPNRNASLRQDGIKVKVDKLLNLTDMNDVKFYNEDQIKLTQSASFL